jgi:hypothetical protein
MPGAPACHIGADGHLGVGHARRQKLSHQADKKCQRRADREAVSKNRRHGETDMGR